MKKLIFILLLISTSEAESHEFNPAHLVVDQVDTQSYTYEASWMYPFKNIGRRAEVIFPNECLAKSSDLYYQGKYIIEKIYLDCSISLKGSSIEIVNLSVLTDALITINFLEDTFEGLVNVQNNIINIPIEVNYYPISYLQLGISHLLDGLDHILFILGLLFLISGILNIIKTITAFTIAHSITLGLSVFGVINLPQSTVEIMIALTIIYLALEIGGSKKIEFTPWMMAFAFGLLHGLGFANVLMDIGIANNQMFLSLLFFNIGIEIGQLMLIPIFSLLIWISNRYKFYKYTENITSYILGSMGFYWFISRFLGLFV